MKTLDYRYALQRISTVLSVVMLTLILTAGLTGILLAYYYEPSAGGAYNSLRYISETVASGQLVRSLHNIAGNTIIIVGLVQIVVMFLGRQFRPSWFVAWVSGFALTAMTIGLGWTAMILDWDQIGFWRLKVELGIIESLPVVGSTIRDILTGGNGINTMTVQHLYTLHSYVLSAIALVLSVVHLASLVIQDRERSQVRSRLDAMVVPRQGTVVQQWSEAQAEAEEAAAGS